MDAEVRLEHAEICGAYAPHVPMGRCFAAVLCGHAKLSKSVADYGSNSVRIYRLPVVTGVAGLACFLFCFKSVIPYPVCTADGNAQASTQSDGALPRLVTPRGPQIPIEHTPAVLRPGGLPYTSALFRSQSMNDGTFDATATPRRAVSVPNLIASMSSLPSPTAGCSAGASFTANSSDDQSSPSVTSSPPPRVASPRSVAIAASTSIDSQRPCPGHHPIATSRSATTAGAHTSNAHTATIAATALPAPVPGLGEHETLAVDTSPPHVQRDAVPVSIQPETASFAVIPPRRRRRRKKRNANRLEGPCVGYVPWVIAWAVWRSMVW